MERVLDDVVDFAVADGWQVELATTSSSPSLQDDRFNAIYTSPVAHPYMEGRYSLAWWLFTARLALRLRGRHDLVFSVSNAGASFLLFGNVRFISQCHGTSWTEAASLARGRQGFITWLRQASHLLRVPREMFVYRRSDIVVSIGDGVAQSLARWPYRIRSSRNVVIPNTIDASFFSEQAVVRKHVRSSYGYSPSDVVMVFAGRLSFEKGADLAVRVLAHLPANYKVHVLGSGPIERMLHDLSVEMNVVERVAILGKVDRDSLRRNLLAADIALLPSRRREGLSMSLLEGLAVGLRVVGTKELDVPADLRSMIWLATSDVESVAQACVDAATSEQKRQLPARYRKECGASSYCSLFNQVSAGAA